MVLPISNEDKEDMEVGTIYLLSPQGIKFSTLRSLMDQDDVKINLPDQFLDLSNANQKHLIAEVPNKTNVGVNKEVQRKPEASDTFYKGFLLIDAANIPPNERSRPKTQKSYTMSLDFRIKFGAPAKILYEIMTTQASVCQFTLSPSIFENKKDGKFEYFNGKISGINLNFIENERIEQEWKMNDWETYSNVKLHFIDQGDECEVRVVQTAIPGIADPEAIENGWKQNIFMNIRKLIGIPIFDQFM